MRPRVFPAEDAKKEMNVLTSLRKPSCFNEAAGIPRGRHTSAALFVTRTRALQ